MVVSYLSGKWRNFYNKGILRLALILSMLLGAWTLPAQISVSAQLDTAQILIGDQVKLNLFISHSKDISVIPPEFADIEAVEGLEIIETNTLDTIRSGEEFLLGQELVLTSFDSGYHVVPKIMIPYTQGGTNKVAMTNDLGLMVTTIPVESDTTSLLPIKTIIREPIKFEDILPYLLYVLAGALLIGLVVFLIKRKNRVEPVVKPEIKIPAHELAFSKLEKLKEEKLWQQGEIKKYQSELTYIIREYLENRYKIPALENTTWEIVQSLKPLDINPNWKEELRSLFETADMVKFAKAEPPIEVHATGMEKVEEFVSATKKIIIETSEEEE